MCACVLKMAAEKRVCVVRPPPLRRLLGAERRVGKTLVQHAASSPDSPLLAALGLGLEALGTVPCGTVWIRGEPAVYTQESGWKLGKSSFFDANFHLFAHGFDTVTVSHSLAMPLFFWVFSQKQSCQIASRNRVHSAHAKI